jgi:hypothetical protein
MAKAAATKNTHATSIDIGIMFVGKECMPIPKRIANEISTKYLTYFFTRICLFMCGSPKRLLRYGFGKAGGASGARLGCGRSDG